MPEERIAWTKKNLAIRIAGPHVVEALEKYGFRETLHQMVVISHSGKGDQYLEEMLTILPTITALRDFLKKIPTYEVDEETFEYLLKSGSVL